MSTQQKIVDTALTLFSKHGYEKTSIRTIAKETDISLGLMYNYFKSKEALLEAIFEAGLDDIKTSFAFPEDSRTPIKDLVENIFSILEEKRAYWRLLHSIRMQHDLMEKFAQRQEEVNNFILTEISLILEGMGYRQPMQEAILLYATIDGIAAHYFMNDKYPIWKIAALLVNKYQNPVSP
ncbi:MAG: TetR/AcrR family transcriptional regulator [Cyclobacteriaceae bacterium]